MSQPARGFSALNLAAPLVQAVADLGYEDPLPIQAACIPPLLAGRDVLGLAQTGTGKTAAFALPLLSLIDAHVRAPQVLVLAPTRELAIQVAEAFKGFAKHLPGFEVATIYGGQHYSHQFKSLKRGPQVVVGTPGRVIDHLDKGTLNLDSISAVVLDEADEMLKMGFVEEVEKILSQAPETRQTALFSATMPPQIRRIIKNYLHDPAEVRIDAQTVTADNIEQAYVVVTEATKFEALIRILETESYDGVLIFARTRAGTTELAERLNSRGFAAEALNGEMTQKDRERTVWRLKNGRTDLLVATDVAARGLDVERISLVINHDMPRDIEAYIHRIGRTGRVGRHGKAILFAGLRERRQVQGIERVTRQRLTPMTIPGAEIVTRRRVEKFREGLNAVMAEQDLDFFRDLSFELMEELGLDAMELAAGLMALAQKDRPLKAEENRALKRQDFADTRRPAPRPGSRDRRQMKTDLVLYRIEVGSSDGVEVRNIVGAITNETGLRGNFIGQIRIHSQYSTVELPGDMPKHISEHLKRTYVGHKPMKISLARR